MLTHNTNGWSLFLRYWGGKQEKKKHISTHFHTHTYTHTHHPCIKINIGFSLLLQLFIFSPCLTLSLSSSSSHKLSSLGGWGGMSALKDFCCSAHLCSCLVWVTQGHHPSWLPLTQCHSQCGPSMDCGPQGHPCIGTSPPESPVPLGTSWNAFLKHASPASNSCYHLCYLGLGSPYCFSDWLKFSVILWNFDAQLIFSTVVSLVLRQPGPHLNRHTAAHGVSSTCCYCFNTFLLKTPLLAPVKHILKNIRWRLKK